MSKAKDFVNWQIDESIDLEEYLLGFIPFSWIYVAVDISYSAAFLDTCCGVRRKGLKPPPFFTSETIKITTFYI